MEMGLERAWLEGLRGKTVRIRLIDGEVVEGTFARYDERCIEIQYTTSMPFIVFRSMITMLGEAPQGSGQPTPPAFKLTS